LPPGITDQLQLVIFKLAAI